MGVYWREGCSARDRSLSLSLSLLQVVEVIIKVEPGFPRGVIKHLSKVCVCVVKMTCTLMLTFLVNSNFSKIIDMQF